MNFFNFFRKITNKTDSQVDAKINSQNVSKTNNFGKTITYNSSTTLIEVLNYMKENASQLGIQFNQPATEIEIENFKNIKIELPKDFKILYEFCNGFETDDILFRLIPLSEIIEHQKDDYLISDNSFHFTEYLIYCDMWSVEINQENIEDYKIYHKVEDVFVLTNSITEFLCVFINKGVYDGLYPWEEEKRINN
ncbi:SMI1/KNR4 family protein [Flavobacterium xinjiangense]|uniref:SMI1 / KNR4 family (SUKH-1) n=1 Tax=Flavobacterium xinjiangense TaxID=178356 RepID=A0A1M7PN74_9FLAO|nr:SMI1/KNR4 family protein [Flavobacterium xinjiangense]SHN18715.1 hypothetical protein SAMN05216269_12014 [Flavobacterium xinjiangense]